MEPLGITVFCDDIRFEQNMKLTIVGVYGPEMLIADNLPVVLGSFGFFVQVRLPPDSPPPTKINIFFPESKDDEPAISVEIAPPSPQEVEKARCNVPEGITPLLSTNVPIKLGPIVINKEGLIKVRVVCGDTIIKAGTLKITRVDAIPTS